MSEEKEKRHQIGPENAAKLKDWFANRGGVFVWSSDDLSDPGWSQFSPATEKDCKTPYGKPHWKANPNPVHVTNPALFDVYVKKEIKRIRIAVRVSTQGMSLKLTDGSNRKVRTTLDKINNDKAWYEFDYETQEAVFYVPENYHGVTLDKYVAPVNEPVVAEVAPL